MSKKNNNVIETPPQQLVFPKFTTAKQIFDFLNCEITEEEKPILFVVMGTKWSPPCRYTMDTALELIKDPAYDKLIELTFLDQDAELQFCFQENIPVGFPTLLVFVNHVVTTFLEAGQSFDPTKQDQKNRLIRQLNMEQLKQVADEAIKIYEGYREAIEIK